MTLPVAAEQLPIFGRKYKLQVLTQDSQQTVLTVSDSAFEPEALRITFDVEMTAWQVLWTAQIVIYNLNFAVTDALLGQGVPAPIPGGQTPIRKNMRVILSAGYQNGKFGTIWDGYVLQALFERENQVDFKVTLTCVLGLYTVNKNFVSMTYTAELSSQMNTVRAMAGNSFSKIPVANLSPALATKGPLPRGRVVFGSPAKYLNEIAADNDMSWWLDSKGLNMGKIDEDIAQVATTAQVFTPTTGIIGTPTQTEGGVQVRLLLDPTVDIRKPIRCIHLDSTQIRQLPQHIGHLPPYLSTDGTYAVVRVRHTGDSRGQAWYTDCDCSLLAQNILAQRLRGLQQASEWIF
jgi:hypothetical protein